MNLYCFEFILLFKQIDGWYFLLSPQYGKRKHLAVHKVTMLTYYGSVDSGIQNGTSDVCQDRRQVDLGFV